MENNLANLHQLVDEALKSMEIYVTDIEVRVEKKYKFLTIELDKIGGLDLDTIVEATNIINPIVDKMDFIEDSYILDIISRERKDSNE